MCEFHLAGKHFVMDSPEQDVFERLESNVRSYCRSFPGLFVSAEGAWLTSSSGRRILDLLSGAGCLNYGHNNPEIMSRVIDYISGNGVVQSLDLHTSAKRKFLIDFEDIILRPRGLDYKIQFPGPAGTNAVEAGLKLARRVTGRRQIAAFTGGFHGMSLGALAATSNRRARAAAGVPLDDVTFWPYESEQVPARESLAAIELDIRSRAEADRPAAAIVELVQGEGGLAAASSHWFRGLAALCEANGILLIVDDIQAGCGRTGSFFSFEGMGVVPDIVLLSKALGGFGAPLAVTLLRPTLDIWQPGEHNGTFRGNNLAFVGGSAALETYWRDHQFERQIAERSGRFRELLASRVCEPGRISLRGRGFMTGLHFIEPGAAAECSRQLFEQGIMAETCGENNETLKFLPPLTVGAEELEFAAERLEAALGRDLRACA